MSYVSIEQTIQEHLQNNWTATEIEWQNAEYDPRLGVSFVRITILPGSERQVAMGGVLRQYRKDGVIFLSVFIPVNIGTREAWTHADNLVALYRGQEINGIIFRGTETNEVGEADGWFQVNVSIDFITDEFY